MADGPMTPTLTGMWSQGLGSYGTWGHRFRADQGEYAKNFRPQADQSVYFVTSEHLKLKLNPHAAEFRPG